MFVLHQTQKDIIKKYPIGHSMRDFYFFYKDIIFKDSPFSTRNEIVVTRFKSKDIFLES